MEWHIWDFPDNVRVYFNEDFRIELFRLLKGEESRNKLARKFGVNTTSIKSYFQTGKDSEGLKAYIPVKIIKNIPRILSDSTDSEFMKKLEKNVVAYRARAGNAVTSPILPIKESAEMYSVIAHMICDGSAGKGKTPAYYNTSKELRENFKAKLQIFGSVSTKEYIVQSNVYAVLFPKAITDILSHIFQTPFVRTKQLPYRIFATGNDYKRAFIRAMYDDEGSFSNKTQLTFTQKEIGIIKDLKKLLDNFGIKTGKIHTDNRGCSTITILSESRELFSEIIGFVHPQKRKKLEVIVEADRTRKNYKPLIDRVNELFLIENGLTRYEIRSKLNSNINSITEILYILRKEGKIKSRFVGKNKPYLWTRVYDEQ